MLMVNIYLNMLKVITVQRIGVIVYSGYLPSSTITLMNGSWFLTKLLGSAWDWWLNQPGFKHLQPVQLVQLPPTIQRSERGNMLKASNYQQTTIETIGWLIMSGWSTKISNNQPDWSSHALVSVENHVWLINNYQQKPKHTSWTREYTHIWHVK